MLFRSVYTVMFLQPRNLQLGAPDRIFCQIRVLAASSCAIRDLGSLWLFID